MDAKIYFSDIEGYEYYNTFQSIKSNHKPHRFVANSPYTINNIKLWIELNHKPYILLSNDYINAQEKLQFKCKVCGYTFLSNWGHISTGRGCRNCQYIKMGKINASPSKDHNLMICHPKLCEEWNYERNKYTPEEYLPSSNKKVYWKCSKCGNEWESTLSHRVHMKSGCPKCCYSKGEIEIAQMLQEHLVEFEREYQFDDCKSKKHLRFDFYLPHHNLCIEYDGEAHFKPVRFGGMSQSRADANFKTQQIRDSVKTQYCCDNNIRLIRIPYYQKEYIEDIILQSIS